MAVKKAKAKATIRIPATVKKNGTPSIDMPEPKDKAAEKCGGKGKAKGKGK